MKKLYFISYYSDRQYILGYYSLKKIAFKYLCKFRKVYNGHLYLDYLYCKDSNLLNLVKVGE